MAATTTTQTDQTDTRTHHVCPWWIGYFLLSPLRTLGENPDRILDPLVEPGMTAIDVGCAMGYFSLPLARKVGRTGRVICVDLQERMLQTLERRARRARLAQTIETRTCTQHSLGLGDLGGQADLVLAVHVVHETTDAQQFLQECYAALKPGGRLLLIEPNGHVSNEEFAATQKAALDAGFEQQQLGQFRRSRSLLLVKP